ncbi:GNAT family N-acetyltransferase [Ekhidna sp.]|uniref:GNAT family N-acetyltransferase n=1 Tax=Ekhidna sp. TaxID=2608089 RepID=UPI003CCB818A
MEIVNKEQESKGSYQALVEGEKVAEMTYSVAGTDRIIIDHTEVNEAYRGTGLGEKLVRKAVKDARNKKISIVPLCPFARSVFDKNEDLKDVL